jgi:hypothetical protein
VLQKALLFVPPTNLKRNFYPLEDNMKNTFLKATAAVAVAIAGIGHNMPPSLAPMTPTMSNLQAVLPRRIVDENRRNQKLQQKLRRTKRTQRLQRYSRYQRKVQKFGSGYRPGKLFKGHRI